MSSLDILRSIEESREPDAVLIRDGVSYGEIREVLRAITLERERREAAEGILRIIRNRGVGGWVTSAIDAHFTRYERD